MVSVERLEAIRSGIERIKQDKPYGDDADAIAALDWVSAATADVDSALSQSSDDTAAMANLQDLLDTLGRLHSSIGAGIKRSGGDVPGRHGHESTGTMNP